MKRLTEMEKYIVDRIENGIVVLEKEDLTHIEISSDNLDFDVKEGNVLLLEKGKYTIDEAAEEERRRKIYNKQKNIFKNK